MITRNFITLLIGLVITSWMQPGINKVDLSNYKIDDKVWICLGTSLDTVYNPDFVPDPVLTHYDSSLDSKVYTLDIQIERLVVDTSFKSINLKGIIYGTWYGGWGSEVLIFTATKQDTVVQLGFLSGRHMILLDPEECIRLKDFDYCSSDYALKGEKDFKSFECTLNYRDKNDILFFGLNNCYAELFDLKKIIKDFGNL